MNAYMTQLGDHKGGAGIAPGVGNPAMLHATLARNGQELYPVGAPQRPTAQPCDPLLLPFVMASREHNAQRHLERLLREHAEPVIRGIVRAKFHVAPDRTATRSETDDERDAQDAYSEALAQLVARLQACRSNPGHSPITRLRAYVAVTTYRACVNCLRHKYPQRRDLKNRLRSLIACHGQFALWESGPGQSVCGLATWRDRDCTHSPRLQRLLEDPRTLADAVLPREAFLRKRPASVLAALFGWLGHPVALNDLVRFLAALWDVREPVRAEEMEEEGSTPLYERAPDQRADVAAQVEQRVYLEQLWVAVCALPPLQRAVLLLNLRDDQNRGVIALLPATGVAGVRRIAAALSMPADQFAALWNRLPLDDIAISQLLGLSHQQVRSLRHVARRRLARRLRGYED